MRFFSRLANLFLGALTQWIGRREHRNPGAVYEAAIQERIEQYAKLREAAAGVIYMRTKLGKELETKSAEHLGDIRAQDDAGADAGEGGCLLVDRDVIEAFPLQKSGRRHAAETGADHGDPRVPIHPPTVNAWLLCPNQIIR